MYLDRNNLEDAMTAFSQVLKQDPDNAEGLSDDALFFMGRLALASGEEDDARGHFVEYLNRFPEEAGAPQVREWLTRLDESGA